MSMPQINKKAIKELEETIQTVSTNISEVDTKIDTTKQSIEEEIHQGIQLVLDALN